jgi:Uma2 family endonuclease
MNAIPLEQEIEYPTSDGQPMAETSLHLRVMIDCIEGLRLRYAGTPDVWVGGNLFLCYEQGNPKAKVAPDVLLAKGISKWDRPNYLLWQETVPSLVMEITSRKTRRDDQGKKKTLYERLGIEEYVLFDPYGEYLKPSLQEYRLVRGRYQPAPLAEDGSLLSRTTGLRLQREGQRLRLVDLATGERVLWPEELDAAHRREAADRRRAEKRAEEAQERVRALEAELARLRKT